MPLGDAQKQQINAWFNQKGVKPDCESCGHSDWKAGHIIVAPGYPADNEAAMREPMPMVQLMCGHCGFVRLYAANLLGLA